MREKDMLLKKMIGMIAFGSLALCAQENNLVGNGDFEEGLYEWSIPEWTPRGKVFSIDEKTSQEPRGTRSLRMDLAKGENATLMMNETFPLQKGMKEYVFSCWLKKAPDSKNNAQIEVRFSFSAEGKKTVTQSFRIKYDELKTEWTEFKKEVALPDTYTDGRVSIMITGVNENATAWIDNIQVTGKK